MKKVVICIYMCVALCGGLEYSLRIGALGKEFAYLIPDFETDLYLNPNHIGEKNIKGAVYHGTAAYPLELRLFCNKFAWGSQYWGNYYHASNDNDEFQYNAKFLRWNDFWLLDMRGKKLSALSLYDIWSMYNDLYYYEYKSIFYGDGDTTRTLHYIGTAREAYKISEKFTIITRSGAGLYYEYESSNISIITEKVLAFLVGKIGCYYRNVQARNRFTSAYFSAGSPLSTEKIDVLPFSVLSHVSDMSGFQYNWYPRAVEFDLGWAKSIPLHERSFIATGFHNTLLYQRTNEADTTIEYRALRNTLTLPLAFEYKIRTFAFWLGAKLSYTYNGSKIWDDTTVDIIQNTHSLRTYQSIGFQWMPFEKMAIDFHYSTPGNYATLARLKEWSIYIKYVY